MVSLENPIYNINRFVLQECGDITEGGFLTCEELVGGYLEEMMGLVFWVSNTRQRWACFQNLIIKTNCPSVI